MDSKRRTEAQPPQSHQAAAQQAGGKAGCCCGGTGKTEQPARSPLPEDRETGCCGGKAASDAGRRQGGRS